MMQHWNQVPRVAVITAVALPAVLYYLIVIKRPYFIQNRELDFRPADPLTDEALEFWAKRGVYAQTTQFVVRDKSGQLLDDIQAYRSNLLLSKQHAEEDVAREPILLDITKADVLVQIHIQKTGGTYFEDFLVKNKYNPCKCKPMPGNPKRSMCSCLNKYGQDWLFNRHSVGWPCGVHAGFNELTSCVDRWYYNQRNENRLRDYHYVTMLRDPVSRFMSEWLNVREGATWKECLLHCDGRDATTEEVPFCFKKGDWSNVTFEEFVNCPHNMAFNRQTRMLANLSLSDCYRQQSLQTQAQRDEVMLESAKTNLARFFSYFGLAEYQTESQLLFERTFPGWKSTERLRTSRWSNGATFAALSESIWDNAIQLNTLDVRLYQYAKDLFLERLKHANIPLAPRANASRRVIGTFRFGVVNEVLQTEPENMEQPM